MLRKNRPEKHHEILKWFNTHLNALQRFFSSSSNYEKEHMQYLFLLKVVELSAFAPTIEYPAKRKSIAFILYFFRNQQINFIIVTF